MKSGRISRRRMLRGLGGAIVGLPFLETFLLRGVRAQTPPAIKRFAVFFECNGVNMDHFWPTTGYGALTDASFAGEATLSALAPFKDKLLIPRGFYMAPRGFGRDPIPGDDHMKGMGCKLTATGLQDTNDKYALGISVDQLIASRINPEGRPSLTLLAGEKRTGVLGHISYRGAGDPVQGENNPWLAYRDFMGVGNGDPTVDDRLVNRRQSVLDLVSDEMDDLKRAGLSSADRTKLDMHFTAIRELEQGMAGAGLTCSLSGTRAQEIEAIDPNTVTYDSEFKKIGQMHMDVMALALACDHTRVATLQWGGGSGGPIFRWDGMSHDFNHHKLSHGNTKDDNSGSEVAGYLDMLHDIDRWFATQYAYLLGKLDGYTEGDKTLLDNSAVVWMNELSDGKGHDFMDLPYVIAGSAGGYLKQGQYVKVVPGTNTHNDTDAPHNQLLTTLINATGARKPDGSPYDNFGTFGKPGEVAALKA